MKVHADCRHYRGDLPCKIGKVCWDCDSYAPYAARHLIVKRGAMGDALRSTPLLRALKKESDAEITWIADADSCRVLRYAAGIDRLLPFTWESAERLAAETFDRVYSLEKDPAAVALAGQVRAKEKIGFALDPCGRVVAGSPGFEEILRLGIDDDFKFRVNTKSVPQMTLEGCGFPWAGETYDFVIPAKDIEWARAACASWGPQWVACNVGVGPRWPTKGWPEASWRALAEILAARGLSPVFLGGENERGLIERIAASGAGRDGGGPYEIGAFTALLALAKVVVSSDSLGLHLALAARSPVVALFCSTTPREIEFYGRGRALASPDGPCYRSHCPKYPACFEKVTPQEAADAVFHLA